MVSIRDPSVKTEEQKTIVASLTTLANARYIQLLMNALRHQTFDDINEMLPPEFEVNQVKFCNIIHQLQIKKEKLKKLREVSQKLTGVLKKIELVKKSALEAYAPIIPNRVALHSAKMFDELFETTADNQSSVLEIKTHYLSNIQKCLDHEKVKLKPESSSIVGQKKMKDDSLTTVAESFITDSLRKWKRSQLGDISYPDDTHCLLDISKSTNFSTLPPSFDSSHLSTRIRAHLREPEQSTPFSLDEVHPLNSEFETMDLANVASSSRVLSLVTSHLQWQQIDHK